MPTDLLVEQALIEASRIQREAWTKHQPGIGVKDVNEALVIWLIVLAYYDYAKPY